MVLHIPPRYNWSSGIEVEIKKTGREWFASLFGLEGETRTELTSWKRSFDSKEAAINYARMIGAEKEKPGGESAS